MIWLVKFFKHCVCKLMKALGLTWADGLTWCD